MDLTFKIIWFEDVDEWYNTTSRRVQRYIENKNYKVNIQRIKKASDYKLNKLDLHNCDLLIIDYELEKVYDQDGEKNIYGSDIIQMIRNGNFFNDILFYSSHGYDVINDIMKQKGLQGVFITDRTNREFMSKVESLIDKAVRRSSNLINIRGIVMDTTSEFDNKITDLINIIWPLLDNEKEIQIANKIKKKILEDNIKTAKKLETKYTNINKENINNLLSERDFSAMRKARLLSWCIESNKELKNKLQTTFKENLQLNNGNEYNKFFEQYNNDIIKYRNALAHVKNSPIDSTQIIGKVDGKDIIFDQNLCNKLRKKLLNYEKVLNNLYEYIENSM